MIMERSNPTFSLIMATLGRTAEVKRFLETLSLQTYRSFELIVVDQNHDNRLSSIIDIYCSFFPITYLKTHPGLSHARNVGLQHVKGKIISFPDDDCWYPQDLLFRVAIFFDKNPEIDGLTGRCVDQNGKPLGGRWPMKAGVVTKWNLWKRHREATVFLRKNVVKSTGYFDETLGVGATTPWGAGEGTDYLLRALEKGYQIYYDPTIIVFHQSENTDPGIAQIKARNYSRGIGYVMQKHQYPFWFLLYWELRSLCGLLLALLKANKRDALVHWANFLGRLEGWRWGKKHGET